jgi:hypothetical protein
LPVLIASRRYFLKRKPTNKTAITKAAAIAVVPWAFMLRKPSETSSLSMTEFSFQKKSEERIIPVREFY